ncbi:hypothetical protein M409DRAFT_25995 [Zasmidium cellare ATCC 36951]|uniref:Peptidase S8/S53 domain-containing protein n=1 Tax=Zasmidium cellare ATCC 36951 TaxID=1080233 RepID=A0A6A6C9J5_ZASCE|nr:uncharacterized protein M409DRAFT_25995 [Zasmidium cellare ATCC 36951]KAF2163814.1 hypothetical protein M409DRAFT_25995 [Zasmidium cellare ATCC 36951]
MLNTKRPSGLSESSIQQKEWLQCLRTDVRSLHALFKVGVALSPAVQSNVKTYWTDHAAQVVAVTGFASLALFESVDWKTALDAALRSPGSASSTTTANDREDPVLYFFSSKPSTPKDVFDTFCKNLDGGKGFLDSFDGNPWQGYQTKLKKAEVLAVKSQPWYDAIQAVADLGMDEDNEVDFDHLDPDALLQSRQQGNETHTQHKRKMDYGPSNTPRQLHILSARPEVGVPIESQDYRFDDSSGEGVTIYFVDSGFELEAAELQRGPSNRESGWHVIPNQLTMTEDLINKKNADWEPLDEDLRGHGSPNHGTGVAIAASGLNYGVAPKANLNFLKVRGTVRKNSDGTLFSPPPQYGAVHRAISIIQNDINLRKLGGKSVVNFSWGVHRYHAQPVDVTSPLYKLFAKFEAWCNDKGLIFVAAAGNFGNKGKSSIPTGGTLPQRVGTKDNALITVGGVNRNGWLWLPTSPEGAWSREPDGLTGSITLYAPASGVEANMAPVGQPPSIRNLAGTSLASPIVAGLAAYFINKRPGNQVFSSAIGKEMKKALVDTAVHWPPPNQQPNVITANNGAWSLDPTLCQRDGPGCRSPAPPPPAPPPKDTYTGKCAWGDEEYAVYYDDNCTKPFEYTVCASWGQCQHITPGFSSMKWLGVPDIVESSGYHLKSRVIAFGGPSCGEDAHAYDFWDRGCLKQFNKGKNNDGERFTANSLRIEDF